MNKYLESDKTSYCLGMSLTIEALKHKSFYVEKVILSNKAIKNNQLTYLLELCKQNNISIEYDDNTISKLSLKDNCYCIGIFKKFYENIKSDEHIVLYGFNDYGELGTTLRSAVSFDFEDIVLINSNIDYFDPRCVRASMGSIFLCNIEKYKDINDYSKKYSNQKLIPFISKSNKELKTLKLDNNFSLIMSQKYYELDKLFKDGYYIEHHNFDEISLSLRTSVILNTAYYLKRNR